MHGLRYPTDLVESSPQSIHLTSNFLLCNKGMIITLVPLRVVETMQEPGNDVLSHTQCFLVSEKPYKVYWCGKATANSGLALSGREAHSIMGEGEGADGTWTGVGGGDLSNGTTNLEF